MPEDTEEYMTLDEAAEAVGLKRPSLYYYLNEMKIKRHRFKFHRHTYITKVDVERIREAKGKLSIRINGEEAA